MTDPAADPRNPFNYPINPDYGNGVFRRKIRLVNQPGRVDAALEDCNHGFCVSIEHDGHRVTEVHPEHRRIPLTTCAGAAKPLKALVGTPLGLDDKALAQTIDSSTNCTHWLDLALLAIAHAARDEAEREYLVNVPDDNGEAVAAQVLCNGRLVHSWMLQNWTVHAPASIAGKPLYRGFVKWASEYFSDADQREAAFILQKGYFVSSARLFDIASLEGDPASGHTVMHGSCYTYSPPHVSHAVRVGGASLRDFTDTPEQLLQFK
jgi:hypothetical protein